MKALVLATSLLFSILTVKAENAIILDITEFAHYPEINSNATSNFISNLYDTYGSHFPTTKLDNSKDGTRYFPSLKNTKEALKQNKTKSLIYISSHVRAKNNVFYVALPESNPSKNTHFLSAKDLTANPSMLIIQSAAPISDSIKKAFKNNFQNYNGAAILLQGQEYVTQSIKLFKNSINSWRQPLLEDLYKNNSTISGRVVNIGQDEINRLKESCIEEQEAAKQAGANEYASELFTAAVIKFRISNSAKLDNSVKDYFKWKQTLNSFLKCKSIALENKFNKLAKELKSEILEIYSHPQWDTLQTNLKGAQNSYSKKTLKSPRSFTINHYPSSKKSTQT